MVFILLGSVSPSAEPTVDDFNQDDEDLNAEDAGLLEFRIEEDTGDAVDTDGIEQHRYQFFESERVEKERLYEQHKQRLKGVLLRKPSFVCKECKKGFGKRASYKKHLKTHRPLLQCPHCEFSTRVKKQFTYHEFRHMKENPGYACEMCPLKFVNIGHLRGHMVRIHSIFECSRCLHRSSSFDERNEHMMAEHGVQIKRKYGSYYTPPVESAGDTEENMCKVCSKRCRSRELLSIHMAQHSIELDASAIKTAAEDEDSMPYDYSDASQDSNLASCRSGKRPYEDTEEEQDEVWPSRKVARNLPVRRSTLGISQQIKKLANDITDDDEDQNVEARIRDDINCGLIERYVNNPEVNLLARIKPASENAVYKCSACDIDILSPMALFQHTVTVHGFLEYDAARRKEAEEAKHTTSSNSKNGFEESLILPQDAGEHIIPQPVKHRPQFIPYFCPNCGPETQFSKYSQYLTHMKTHKLMSKCPGCKFKCKSKLRILIHQIKAHKNLLRCPKKCLKLFRTKEELDNHKASACFP